MNTTIETWRYLQENNYFEKHRLYNFTPIIPPIKEKDIKNKIVVEIGCGYGRETCYISKIAKKVYAIEVSKTIIDKAKLFVKEHGIKEKIDFVLVDNYKKRIPNEIDYVYSRLVFQHITHQQAKDYIDTFYEKLKNNGKIHIQFRLGYGEAYPKLKEPTVKYSYTNIVKLFRKFKITENIIKQETDSHIFIIGIKNA